MRLRLFFFSLIAISILLVCYINSYEFLIRLSHTAEGNREMDSSSGSSLLPERYKVSYTDGVLGKVGPPSEATLSQQRERTRNDELKCSEKSESYRVMEGNKNLMAFKNRLDQYTKFHRQQLELISNGSKQWSDVPTITLVCSDNKLCCGIGDQFNKIELTLILALASDRLIGILWDSVSMRTMKYLQPNQVRWDEVGNFIAGTKRPDVVKLKSMEYSAFKKEIFGGRTNVVLDHNLPMALKHSMIVLDLDILIPLDVLDSLIIQYLFKFHENLHSAVAKLQMKLGLVQPYFALHLRTGFLGSENQEVKKYNGTFSKLKILRNSNAWRHALDCSITKADSVLGSNSPLFLATDSYLVKDMAKKMYPGRVITLDFHLQHVIFSVSDSSSQDAHLHSNSSRLMDDTGLDQHGLVWLDFLLLAHSHAILRGSSGFSVKAGWYCPIPISNVFTFKQCKEVKQFMRHP